MVTPHIYEIELVLDAPPKQGFVLSGFQAAHKLPNGNLCSGQYEFDDGVAYPNEKATGELSIFHKDNESLDEGTELVLLNPIESVGMVKIIRVSDRK